MKRRAFIGKSLISVSLLATSAGEVMAVKPQADDDELNIINAGVGGNNTIDLLARIESDCIAHKPGLIIFMAGTNDMNSKKFVALKEYEKNMQQMLSMMKKTGARIMLMNLLPVYEPYLFTRHDPGFYSPEGHAGRLQQMNATVKKLAQQNKTSYVDLYKIFSGIGNIGMEVSSLIKNEANSKTTDGLHPTADGYRVMAVAIHAQLVCEGLADTKKIVCFGDSITRGDANGNYPSYLQKLLS